MDMCWGCRYEFVGALIRDFPELHFTINGGITSLQQASGCLQPFHFPWGGLRCQCASTSVPPPQSQELLGQGVYGVMIGRAAYSK